MASFYKVCLIDGLIWKKKCLVPKHSYTIAKLKMTATSISIFITLCHKKLCCLLSHMKEVDFSKIGIKWLFDQKTPLPSKKNIGSCIFIKLVFILAVVIGLAMIYLVKILCKISLQSISSCLELYFIALYLILGYKIFYVSIRVRFIFCECW